MSAIDRAHRRLAAANPVPEPERFMAGMAEMDAALRDFEEGIMQTTRRTRPEPSTPTKPRRQSRTAAVALVAVLVLVGGALIALTNDSREVVGSDPIDVVDTFFERWNDDDVEGAVALLDPGVSVAGVFGIDDIRALMEFLAPFDGSMDATCTPGPEPELVTCSMAWNTVGTRALGLRGSPAIRFTVQEGLVTSFGSPNYDVWERRLVEFASEIDQAGYEAACSSSDEAPTSPAGNERTRRCGGFLAGLEQAFADSVDG